MNDVTPTPAPYYGRTRIPADADGHLVRHWDDLAPAEMVAEWQRDDTTPPAAETFAAQAAADNEKWPYAADLDDEDITGEDPDDAEWWYHVDLSDEELAELLAENDEDADRADGLT